MIFFIYLFLLFDIFHVHRAGKCDVSNSTKKDCGYVGVTESDCEGKGCCWKEEFSSSENGENDIPWCYYPNDYNNCFLMDNDTSVPPFTEDEINEMFSYWLKNFDIEGKGGVCAAPSDTESCSAGSYYFHWMRDSGLSCRARMMLQDYSQYWLEMKTWVEFVLKIQNEPDPNDIDVRVEPKFTLPDGWCRPQSDGPAIRSTTLIDLADVLIKNGQKEFVTDYLWTTGQHNGGAIKFDLEWVTKNWESNTCNLWEDHESTDFFWNRMSFALALKKGSEFADKMGDQQTSNLYYQQFVAVNATIDPNHWDGQMLFEVSDRKLDTAVIIALNHYTDIYPQNSFKVASTVQTYLSYFCDQYEINLKDTQNGVPGVLFGRYEGDVYCGGNPWILLSAGLAELFYRASSLTLQKGLPEASAVEIWKDIFSYDDEEEDQITKEELATLFVTGGDSILKRIVYHTKGADFHLAEQLDKVSGYEVSAQDLTWSYSNVLRANYFRSEALRNLERS